MSEIVSLDSLSGLLAFATTVDAGGFTAAGRKLGVSGSAVGKSVDRLEGRLGVVLLQRTTRSIALTREGEALYARAKQILVDVRDAEDVIRRARVTPEGRVRVSVPAVLGRIVIIPALAAFVDNFPDVEVELSLEDRIIDIVTEGFDLAIRLGEMSDSTLIARKIGPHRFTTCASPSYLAACGVPSNPDDLACHRCIRYRFPSTGLLEQWEYAGKKRSPSLGRGLVLNDGEALASAAIGGLGLAQLPTYQVAAHLSSGRLHAVLEKDETPRGDIWLVWPPGRSDIPRVRVFAEFITTLLSK
jgi:DNA-binding transcriptional LysR family regulator